MDLVTSNVLRHVYEVLHARKRLADSGNISNLQLFYNRLTREYSETRSDKKSGQWQWSLSLSIYQSTSQGEAHRGVAVPLTGQDVDDFYSGKMTRQGFLEVIRTKVISKVANFNPSMLHVLCWECFCGSPDDQVKQTIARVDQQSATLLWLLFCKLDTDGKLKLHTEDVGELMILLMRNLGVTPDRKAVGIWLANQMGSSVLISFWPYFTVIVEKCLATSGAKIISTAVKALHDEIVDEVLKCAVLCKKGTNYHTWKTRWFVLTSNALTYYESKELLVKKGALVINALASVEVMNDKNETRYPNRFKVTDGSDGHFTEISADTAPQMNEWVKAINKAIKINVVKGRNYLHKLQIVKRKPTSTKSARFASRSCENIDEIGKHNQETLPFDKGLKKHASSVREISRQGHHDMRRLQTVSGCVKMDDPQSLVKYSAPTPQQHVLNNTENDGTNLSQNTATGESKETAVEGQSYGERLHLTQANEETQQPRVASPIVIVHECDTTDEADRIAQQIDAAIHERTKSPIEEKYHNTITQGADTKIPRPVSPGELPVETNIQHSGKQQELEIRLCSLEQSVIQLQRGLSIEKQNSSSLETSCKTLHTALMTEQQRSESLETRYKSLEAMFHSLKTKCESLESSLAAEKQKSQSLEAKCNSQEGRLRAVEDTVERLWAISRDEINLSNKILGTGGWGYVTEATFRGRRVAAKCLHEAIISPHNQGLFAKEMKISARCRHKNLVEFIGAVPDHPAIIVIEMMDCTLRSALTNRTATPKHIHPICIDVALGLAYLHSIQPHPLIHRDVSAPNVLLKAVETGWIAKLSDLGSAQFANIAQTLAPGCVLYAAPEVQQRDTALKQTEKIDVYSYGVLLIEILTREMPTGILSELISSLQEIWPQFVPLIQKCTNTDSETRPTMKEVIVCLNKIIM